MSAMVYGVGRRRWQVGGKKLWRRGRGFIARKFYLSGCVEQRRGGSIRAGLNEARARRNGRHGSSEASNFKFRGISGPSLRKTAQSSYYAAMVTYQTTSRPVALRTEASWALFVRYSPCLLPYEAVCNACKQTVTTNFFIVTHCDFYPLLMVTALDLQKWTSSPIICFACSSPSATL